MQFGAEKISFWDRAVAAGADAGAKRSGIVASPLKSSVLVVGDDARTFQALAGTSPARGLDFVTEGTARAALKRVRETATPSYS